MAYVLKCDKCDELIADKMTTYMIQLEEWDQTGYAHAEAPDTYKRAQICPSCYKQLMNEIMP